MVSNRIRLDEKFCGFPIIETNEPFKAFKQPKEIMIGDLKDLYKNKSLDLPDDFLLLKEGDRFTVGAVQFTIDQIEIHNGEPIRWRVTSANGWKSTIRRG